MWLLTRFIKTGSETPFFIRIHLASPPQTTPVHTQMPAWCAQPPLTRCTVVHLCPERRGPVDPNRTTSKTPRIPRRPSSTWTPTGLWPRPPVASRPCSDQAKTLILSQYRPLCIKFKVLTRLIRINRPMLTHVDPFCIMTKKQRVLRLSRFHQISLR